MVVRKIFAMVILFFLFSNTPLYFPAGASTIYVGAGGDYATIQDAVDNANDGDIIYVMDGVYQGGINVDKAVSIIGQSRNAVIECGSENGFVLMVNNVTIDGLTIKNATEGKAGILEYAEGIIKNCNFSNNDEGIHCAGSSNGIIMDNIFFNNNYAITLINSYHNEIKENYFIKNSFAISLGKDTSDNIMYYNNFMDNVVDAKDESGLNYWDYEHVGNYWDRYNGIDADGDGIGDTPYKIDEARGIQDSYPLMENYTGIDIFPPDITDIVANPQIQIPGGYVNITCNVIDNVEVNKVFLNITTPNLSYINVSLNHINNSSTYFFNNSYSSKGIYYFYIWANDTNNNSEKSSLQKFVIAYKPHADFVYTPENPSDIDTIYFNSTSYDTDGFIANYTWKFGDGSIAYGKNVTHRYDEDGVYEITLTVIDNDGAWDVKRENITVSNVPPIVNLTWELLSPHYEGEPYVGQEINFISQSYDPDGQIMIYQWDFGDGNSTITSTNSTIYSYSKNGLFKITLTAVDNDYGETSVSKTIEIHDIFPPAIQNLRAYPNPQEIWNNINISCLIVDDVGVNVARLIINQPDGKMINTTMNKSNNTYFYIYYCNLSGNYSYYVFTTDINGNANTSSLQTFKVIVPPEPPAISNITVSPAWQAEYGEVVNISCYVEDNVGVDSVIISLSGNHTMNGITDENGNGVYYHLFNLDVGSYRFRIYATDVNGYKNSTLLYNFTVVDTTPPSITNVSFKKYVSPGSEQLISWNVSDAKGIGEVTINITFPDGHFINESMYAVPFHYNFTCQTGEYSFYIWAVDTSGNGIRSQQFNFTATYFPVANFTYYPSMPLEGQIIYFNSTSYDTDGFITNHTWKFGDGSIAYGSNVSHSYSSAGIYNVTLVVFDNNGANDSITKSINVTGNTPPVANFTYYPSMPLEGQIIYFNSTSYDTDGFITNYTWDFGDGSIAYGSNVSHSYSSAGIYNVTLVVSDNNGANDSITKSINVTGNTPPLISIIYPENGSTVCGIVMIEGNASDDGEIFSIQIRIDNGMWKNTSGNSTWMYRWNTTQYEDGFHVVEARAYDGSFYSYDSIILNVSNTIDFYYEPVNAISRQPIYFYAPAGAAAYTWDFGDGSIAYGSNASHSYPIGNFYNVTLMVRKCGVNLSVSKVVRVDTGIDLIKNSNNVVNFVAWSAPFNISASQLASLIGSPMGYGSVVSKWNTTKGMYDDYIVGVSPPEYDFIIKPGDSVVLRVTSSGSFVINASLIHNRTVVLIKNSNNVVNFVAWLSLSNISASQLASLIGSPMGYGSVVSKWNTTKGMYDDYIVGVSPPEYDFIIKPGDSVVLRVTSSGSFVMPEVIK